MATVYVDNKPYQMNAGANLLEACLSQGFNLPYFCWHPALGSVGACRQCAVKQFKDEQDTRGRLVMACVTPVAEGARISIADREAAAFRKTVIEGLMLNHPHDCPVCDEGGECHLQDMTVMTGHAYRRSRFPKRTFRNQDLGPLVNHEMNRCIQCYRCVRYYRDYAGGRDLNAFAIHDVVFFGREEDGVLENEFSGNLVEICPTGVFTDKTLKSHYTRKWDQLFAPSICVHCGMGCNTSAGERYGLLRRIVNRFNYDVNGYFLCDRGRFGYEFVNSERRIRSATLNGRPVPEQAIAEYLRDVVAGNRAVGIGSPRASLEGNFALRKLVGPDRFFSGMADDEARLMALMVEIQRRFGAPTLHEVEQCDAVFVLGEDVTNSSPRVALSLRQSVRQSGFEIAKKMRVPLWLDRAVRDAAQDVTAPLFIATPYATRLEDVATAIFHAAPDSVARLGFAVAHELDPAAPPSGNFPDAAKIAQTLKNAKRPLVISGAGCGSEAVIRAAANVAKAAGAALLLIAPECNSVGAALMGGGLLTRAFELVSAGKADTAVVLENDLYRRAPASEVDALLTEAANVIVLDSLSNRTTARANLLLPAGTFAESDGTLVSSEGRAQRFLQVFVPPGEIQESWRWLDIFNRSWPEFDDVLAAISAEFPELARARDAAPSAAFRMAGAKIPRGPHRYSGRTAMTANIAVSEPKPPDDPDTPLSFSMEGTEDHPPPPVIPFFWTAGWNSIQATNFYQREVGGPLRGGVSGVRLFEPGSANGHTYFAEIPLRFEPREGEWLIVPIHHIFGSEELSLAAPGIARLAPEAYVAVGGSDFANGSEVELRVAGQSLRLPVQALSGLPRGVAGLPLGVPPLTGISLPAWGSIASVA